jgi:hypothetical protein
MKKLRDKSKNQEAQNKKKQDLIALQSLIARMFSERDDTKDDTDDSDTEEEFMNELDVTEEDQNVREPGIMTQNRSILRSNMDVSYYPEAPPGTPTTFNNHKVLDPTVLSFHPENGSRRTFAKHLGAKQFIRSQNPAVLLKKASE